MMEKNDRLEIHLPIVIVDMISMLGRVFLSLRILGSLQTTTIWFSNGKMFVFQVHSGII